MHSIYLADDHKVVRTGLRTMLQAAGGFRIIGEAANGEAALADQTLDDADILLLDANLGDMDGLQVLRKLHARGLGDLKVVLFTMYADPYLHNMYRDAGAHAIICKDTDPEELIDGLRLLADNQALDFDALSGISEPVESDVACKHQVLSGREMQVLISIANGARSRDIAVQLDISDGSVSTYLQRIRKKLQVSSNADLVRYALQQGLIV